MQRYTITMADTGETALCGADEYVLGALFKAGKGGHARHGCHGGGCGICKMKVLEGEFLPAKRMSRAHISEAEEAQGIVLACCILPRTNLVLQKV